MGSGNLRGDLPAYQAMCKIIDASIGVLGPELQDSTKVRTLVLNLAQEFAQEADEGICVEATKGLQHFIMFAPEHVNLPDLIHSFKAQLSSSRRPLKLAAINGFYQLVQRNVSLMSKFGGDKLVEDLFGLLDDDPSIDGVRNVILSWLKQTSEQNPSGWIDLCQRIMARSTVVQSGGGKTNQDVAGGIRDDEVESVLGPAGGAPGIQVGGRSGRLTSRWRTQLFALQCLHAVFVTVLEGGRKEHFDVGLGKALRLNPRTLLITRIADLIRMAFTASTAQVTEIRLEGLVVLRDVIEVSSKSSLPASLLTLADPLFSS